MSEANITSTTFFRCCAVAKLEDTSDHSSVVGYKCKAICMMTGVITTSLDNCLW